tara:strand:- start:83 stop:676 length:594 start_codon:yes stop_codon:yes gene_type:complete
MNGPTNTLADCIHVEKGIIPSSVCDYIIDEIETKEWSPHTWYNWMEDSVESEPTMELDVQTITAEFQEMLTPIIIKAGYNYTHAHSYRHPSCVQRTSNIMQKLTPIRFNRYSSGQIMRQHIDHIHDIFDGKEKGIPVLSFILNFNDDYEGADLFFWEDHVIPLGKGDIVMFPSLFLFPHGVTEATKGMRYSGVCWSF